MENLRSPFQGVKNIIQFNWHYFLLALISILILYFIQFEVVGLFKTISVVLLILISLITIMSLLISYYVYDKSNLYQLDWLDDNSITSIANIHAGFDEFTPLLINKYKNSHIYNFNFFNPERNTEVSIKRAQGKGENSIGSERISFDNIPLENNSLDMIFVLFSAHEIRDDKERVLFFKELKRVLRENGKIYIVEHLRDPWNFFAYNVGFLHFFSLNTWFNTFKNTGFEDIEIEKLNPFVTNFIIRKNDNTA